MTCLDELEDLFLQNDSFMLSLDLCEAADVWDLLANNKLNYLVKVDNLRKYKEKSAQILYFFEFKLISTDFF